MYIGNDKVINFAKFDSLILYLEEAIQHVPEMKSRRSRAQFAAHASTTLHKIWNLGRGTDVDEFCDGGSPSPLDGEC